MNIAIIVFLGIFLIGWSVWMYKNKFFRYSTVFLFFSFLLYFGGFFTQVFQFSSLKNIQQSSILFVLDVSKSMDALDYEDNQRSFSRLEASKKIIQEFIKKHPNNEFSLQIFAGDTLSVFPFTSDTDAFLTSLEGVDSDSLINGGNDIKTAFSDAVKSFEQNKVSGGVILLSDFEFPKTSSLEVQKYYQNFPKYNKSQIQVFAVGVGKDSGSNIPLRSSLEIPNIFLQNNFLLENGKKVVTKYDENSHNALVEKTQAKKLYLKNISDVNSLLGKITSIPGQEISIKEKNSLDFLRISTLFSAIFFLLFLGSTYLERRKKYLI